MIRDYITLALTIGPMWLWVGAWFVMSAMFAANRLRP